MKKTLSILLVPFAALSLAACSFSVDSDDLETQISNELAELAGYAPEEIDCPDDLEAEVGATTQCVLTHEGVSLPVDVTVTSVEDRNVAFDIEVGEEPLN